MTSFACSVLFQGTLEDCSHFQNVPESSAGTLKSSCKGTVETSCPSTGIFGSCTSAPHDGSNLKEIEYAYSAAGATSLQAQCADENGTWSSNVDGGGTADAGNVCSVLSTCCQTGHFTMFESQMKTDCTMAAASGNQADCESQLTALTAESICGTASTPDAGSAHDAGGPCDALKACCASSGLSSQVKSICKSDGKETDPEDCTGTLNTIMADGDCKGS